MSKQPATVKPPKGDWLHNAILALSRDQKRGILMVIDAMTIPFALWLAFVLRIGIPSLSLIESMAGVAVLSTLLAVAVFWYTGLYSTLVRSMENRTMITIATGSVIIGLFVAAAAYMDRGLYVPRSVPAIFAILIFLCVGLVRVLAKSYYRYAIGFSVVRQPVLIYGAGTVGIQLASALENSQNFSVVGFIDDDPLMQGRTARGRKVYAPDKIDRVVNRHENLRVLIAIAKITPAKKRAIIQRLERFPVRIDSVPALSDIVSGEVNLSEIEKVEIEDLLGRDPVPPIQSLFVDAIKDKCIFVSGAGGSIGSEICKQVLQGHPRKLVLFEQNELGLYQVENALRQQQAGHSNATEIFCILGDATNQEVVERALEQHKPEVFYHAAAYKHVPMVEANVCEGIFNNAFGTKIVAEAAARFGVERFILVSTDKAVRPTNVMGASKRVAEQVVQDLASRPTNTIFSMVRFGNVLGSSGSVIPMFKSQIAKLQPITVTHPEVTRYFMTIPEAAQLVIQAGFMAKGGEVYVLDMGDPVKILDLAKLVIQLAGYRVKDSDSPNGDIPINFIGLRPGEKLYEELLIGADVAGTDHPKIMSAFEKMPSHKQLSAQLKKLEGAISTGDDQACRKVLATLVEGFPQ